MTVVHAHLLIPYSDIVEVKARVSIPPDFCSAPVPTVMGVHGNIVGPPHKDQSNTGHRECHRERQGNSGRRRSAGDIARFDRQTGELLAGGRSRKGCEKRSRVFELRTSTEKRPPSATANDLHVVAIPQRETGDIPRTTVQCITSTRNDGDQRLSGIDQGDH
ncbi:hypothetical protein D3C81_1575170 [compost metagenome]